MYTRNRQLIGILLLLTWLGSTLGLCIPSFRVYVVLRLPRHGIDRSNFSGHKLGLWLFAAAVTVACLVRAVCAVCSLLEFDRHRPTRGWWGWWEWRREETPLGLALVYDLIRLIVTIAVAWSTGAYGPRKQKEPFSSFELICYTVSLKSIRTEFF